METDKVCFPEPLGCFTLPSGGPPSIKQNGEDEEYADEHILSDASLAATLRAQDPPGCFLCIAETLGDDDL